jgi:hypothetical protein
MVERERYGPHGLRGYIPFAFDFDIEVAIYKGSLPVTTGAACGWGNHIWERA